jgi:hypothetical protein
MRKTNTDISIACVTSLCPTVSTALHLSISRQATFRLPRLVHLLESSYRTCTPHYGASPTAARWASLYGPQCALCRSSCSPAGSNLDQILPTSIFPAGRIAEDFKPPSGHMLLCLAAWRIVTSSGQDRVCLTSNRDPIGLGTTGGPVELQLMMRRASGG